MTVLYLKRRRKQLKTHDIRKVRNRLVKFPRPSVARNSGSGHYRILPVLRFVYMRPSGLKTTLPMQVFNRENPSLFFVVLLIKMKGLQRCHNQQNWISGVNSRTVFCNDALCYSRIPADSRQERNGEIFFTFQTDSTYSSYHATFPFTCPIQPHFSPSYHIGHH